MIADYEAMHPNIQIHWVDVPFNEGKKRALTAMLSPKVPDVVNLNPGFAATLAARGALLDLDKWTTEAIKREYLPVAWEASSLNGAAFGFPWYLTSSITIVNQALLDQAGVQEVPRDWNGVQDLVQAVSNKTDAFALMPVISEHGNFFKALLQAGIPVFDVNSESSQMVFANHGAAKLLQNWVTLYQEKLVPPEALTKGHSAAVERFQAGSLALLMAGPSFLKQVADNAPSVYANTRVAPQLLNASSQSNGYTDFSTMVLVVPSKSAHPKEAVEFAAYVTNPKNQKAFIDAAPVLPSITSLLTNMATSEPADLKAQAQALSAQQVLAAAKAFPLHPQQHEMNEILDLHVQLALLGKESSSQAMGRAQAEINALLQ